jgi:hypothetical protein
VIGRLDDRECMIVHYLRRLPAAAGFACLADCIRGHWAIEALHHIRDTTRVLPLLGSTSP